jgi:3'-phosphoadenosine 5'-phosphosulfate (PAPS) 3'-phosphatase
VGGLGNKIVLMLHQQVDLIINLNNKSSRWDICAGDALIQALGGSTTTLEGGEICYDESNNSQINKKGLICSFDKKFHHLILQKTSQYHPYIT